MTFRTRCSIGSWIRQFAFVIRSEDTKHQLARAAVDQFYLAEAPVVIVVIADTRRSKARYGERGETFYSIVDGAFASLLVMLAAIDAGLGAAFVGAFNDDEVRAVLGLPKAVRPIGSSGSTSSTTSGGKTGITRRRLR